MISRHAGETFLPLPAFQPEGGPVWSCAEKDLWLTLLMDARVMEWLCTASCKGRPTRHCVIDGSHYNGEILVGYFNRHRRRNSSYKNASDCFQGELHYAQKGFLSYPNIPTRTLLNSGNSLKCKICFFCYFLW